MKTVLSFVFVVSLLMSSWMPLMAQKDIKFPESCSIKGPKFGTADTLEAQKNFSLYRENFKQWKKDNFKGDAIKFTIEPWRYCFLNVPLCSQNMYLDGVRIVGYMIDNAADSATKEKYIDTLMMLYDKNIEAFGCAKLYGEGYILGRKGYDLYKYRPNEKELAYYTMEKSINILGNETEAAILSFYFKLTDELIRMGYLDTALVYSNYEKAISIAQFQLDAFKAELKANPADSNKINKKIETFTVAEGNIASIFDPWASCEQVVKIYGSQFDSKQTDCEWLNKLCTMLENKKCTDDPLYAKAAIKSYECSPTSESAMSLGNYFLGAKNYSEAVKYYNEAVKGTEDVAKKAKAYHMMAEAYRAAGQYANARNAANSSLQFDPTNGEAYILIGDMYMSTASSCGDNDVTKRAGYWAAADKYAKAKAVSSDEKVINSASSKLGSCYSGFPTKEDLFFYSLSPGSSYTVSCWYTESTIIRSRD